MKKVILILFAVLMNLTQTASALPGKLPEEMTQPKPERDIYGLWKLTDFYITEEGQPNKDWCQGAHGVISYKDTGTMYVAIQCEGTEPGSGAEALGGALFYAGNFAIDGEAGTVTHIAENANSPALVKDHIRTVTMESRNSLTLTGALPTGTVVVEWRRLLHEHQN